MPSFPLMYANRTELLAMLGRGEITLADFYDELNADDPLLEQRAESFRQRIEGVEVPSFEETLADLESRRGDTLAAEQEALRPTHDLPPPPAPPSFEQQLTTLGEENAARSELDALLNQYGGQYQALPEEQIQTNLAESNRLREEQRRTEAIDSIENMRVRLMSMQLGVTPPAEKLFAERERLNTLPLDQVLAEWQALSDQMELAQRPTVEGPLAALAEFGFGAVPGLEDTANLISEQVSGQPLAIEERPLDSLLLALTEGQPGELLDLVPRGGRATDYLAEELPPAIPRLAGEVAGVPGQLFGAGARLGGRAAGAIGGRLGRGLEPILAGMGGMVGFETPEALGQVAEGDVTGALGTLGGAAAVGAGFGALGTGYRGLTGQLARPQIPTPAAAPVRAPAPETEVPRDLARRAEERGLEQARRRSAGERAADEELDALTRELAFRRQVDELFGEPAPLAEPARPAALAPKPVPEALPPVEPASGPAIASREELVSAELLQHARKVTGNPKLTLEEMATLPGTTQAEIVNTLPVGKAAKPKPPPRPTGASLPQRTTPPAPPAPPVAAPEGVITAQPLRTAEEASEIQARLAKGKKAKPEEKKPSAYVPRKPEEIPSGVDPKLPASISPEARKALGGGAGTGPFSPSILGENPGEVLLAIAEAGAETAKKAAKLSGRSVAKAARGPVRLGERALSTTTARLRKIKADKAADGIILAEDLHNDLNGRITERLKEGLEEGIAINAPKKAKGRTKFDVRDLPLLGRYFTGKKMAEEITAVWKARTYGTPEPKISTGTKRWLDKWGEVYRDTGIRFDQLGGKVFDRATGKMRKIYLIGEKGHPRMLTQKARDQLLEKEGPLYREAVEFYKSKGLNPETLINGFHDAPNGFSANLELSRSVALPEHFYEWDPLHIMPKWNSSVSKRLADMEVFGPSNLDVARLIKETKTKADREIVMTALGRHFGEPGMTAPEQRFLSGLSSFNVLTKLSGPASIIRNISQGFSTAGTFGFKRWAISIDRLMKDPAFRKSVRESGVLHDNTMLALDLGGLNREGWLAGSASIGTIPFRAVEKYTNRMVAAGAADIFVRDMLKEAARKSLSTGRRNFIARNFERLGLDLEEILARPKPELTRLERSILMQRGVRVTQFTTETSQMPLWAKSSVAQPFTQFKSFSYQQARFLKDVVIKELKHGNIRPLAAVLLGGTVTGEGIYEFRRFFQGRERRDRHWTRLLRDKDFSGAIKRIIADLATTGTLGLYGDIIESTRATIKGQEPRSITTPIGMSVISTGGDLANRLYAQGEAKGDALGYELFRAVMREVPVARFSVDTYRNFTGTSKQQRRFNEVRRLSDSWKKFQGIRDYIPPPGPRTVYYRSIAEAMLDKDKKALDTALRRLKEVNQKAGKDRRSSKQGLRQGLNVRKPVDLNKAELEKFLAAEGPNAKDIRKAIQDYDDLVKEVMNRWTEIQRERE